MDIENFSDEKTILLDVRDYLQAHKKPINGSYNIPLPYIKRNFRELEGKPIYYWLRYVRCNDKRSVFKK